MTKEYKENPTFGDANFEYKEGMYFGMPEEEYHKIPYFSRSFSEDMNFDYEEAWYKSNLNPNKPEHQTTSAMELGKAIHSMILEPNMFKVLYVEQPKYSDYKGVEILKDTKDLKTFLKKFGEKTSLLKQELIHVAEKYLHPDTQVIWDNVIRDFELNVEKHDKRILKQDDVEILDGIKESLDLRPEIKNKFQEEGYSEVVIIWEDEFLGLTCKSRLDRLSIDRIIDVKSFSVKNKKKPLMEYLENEIRYQNYNLQSSMYFQGLKTVITKIRNEEAEVFGEVDQEWLSKFLENENKEYSIIFTRTQAPYQIREIPLMTKQKKLSENLCYTQGVELFLRAAKDFILCQEKFKDKRWVNHEVKSPKDDVFMYQVQV